VQDVPTVRIDRSLRRSLSAFGEDRLGWLDRAAALGPLSGLRFGPATVFVVTDPELARSVLVTDRAWSRPPSQRVPVALAVGENLFSASDRAWARAQPEIAPAFRRRALAEPLAGLDRILSGHVDAIPVGDDIDLGTAVARLAFVAAAWVVLGDRVDAARADELVAHQAHVVDWVGRRLGALDSAVPVALGRSAADMRAHRRVLEEYVGGAVARVGRREDAPPILAGARRAASSSRQPDRALREHLLGLLLAGNETTAAALSWLLVHAAAHPDEWRRLSTEPERVRGFVAETLRLTPPAWGVTRTPTRKPAELAAGGASVRVRRPGVVTIYLRGIQRSGEWWPDPLRFDPDRHDRPGAAPALLPFALGPRGCVGQHLALEEISMVARCLSARDVVAGPVAEDAGFALRPRGSLRGRFVARAAA
jgi:cytochrome P450